MSRWPQYQPFTPDQEAAVEEWIAALECPEMIAKGVRKKFHFAGMSAEQIRADYKSKLEQITEKTNYEMSQTCLIMVHFDPSLGNSMEDQIKEAVHDGNYVDLLRANESGIMEKLTAARLLSDAIYPPPQED